MKLTKQNVEDIKVLLEHAETDIGYGSGGTHSIMTKNMDFVADEKSIKSAERASLVILDMVIYLLKKQNEQNKKDN